MLPGSSSPPETTAALDVTVTDIAGVQRLLTMLSGRGYRFTRFEAGEAGARHWRVTVDLVLGPEQVELLRARVHRVPSVLAAELRTGGVLAAIG